MSKKSKKASKIKNLAAKRARKAANKARYEELRRTGQNSKSKRARSAGKKKRLANAKSHPNGTCGNIGCKKCDPCKVLYNLKRKVLTITKAN